MPVGRHAIGRLDVRSVTVLTEADFTVETVEMLGQPATCFGGGIGSASLQEKESRRPLGSVCLRRFLIRLGCCLDADHLHEIGA